MKRIVWSLLALIVVAGAAYWIYSTKSTKSTIKGELTDFAIQDTAAVDRIFLVDEQGNRVLLERDEKHWTLNDQYLARPDAVRILMETIHKVKVKAPVSQPAMENVLKDIMGNHTKIEIYQGNDTPVKTYFVGSTNQKHTGTHMLIEGSSRPFVTHIEGFHGFLTPRYFTNENEWRNREIFDYKYGELKSVKMTYNQRPENNFMITDLGDHESFEFSGGPAFSAAEGASDVAIKRYLANFKMIHFEGFEETKSEAFIDSVKKSTPLFTIEVEEWTGESHQLHGYRKPIKDGYDPEGQPVDFDQDRLYLYMDSFQFVVGQYVILDRLTYRASDFFGE